MWENMAKVNKDLLEDIMRHIGVLIFKLDEMDDKIDRLMSMEHINATNDFIRQSIHRSNSMHTNISRLDEMIKEFKGLVAIVRPEVKKSGWHGEEIKTQPRIQQIEYKELEN